MNPFLKPCIDYAFDRDEFTKIILEVFTPRELFELESLAQGHKQTENFLLYYYEDTFYFIHLPSGTIVSYYKHCGRSNTVNKVGFMRYDLKVFFTEIKKEVGYHDEK